MTSLAYVEDSDTAGLEWPGQVIGSGETFQLSGKIGANVKEFQKFWLIGGIRWLDDIEFELDELKTLEENWDSYGGQPIDRELIPKAMELLRAIRSSGVSKPFVAPVPNGGINIEWNTPEKFLGVKIRKDEIRYFFANRVDGTKKPGKIIKNEEINSVLDLL